ncbi:MAG: YCF48-related protein [Ignavibacteriae bacterium]|nr:YCF48-related protein [Ignavibacteriota bacterium]
MKTKTIKLLILLVVFISSYTQGGWVLQSTGTTTFISSIAFPNEMTGFASGWSSTILKTTNGGTNWFSLSCPVSVSLSSTYFVDVTTGWMVGSGGTIIKTTDAGQSWQLQVSGTSTLLMLTNFANAQTGYVVGYSGVIIKTTNGGNNWVSQNSGVTVNLLSVKFVNALTGYVTGDLSRILKTTNGGTNWESLVSGIYNNLGKIAVTDAYTAYVPATDGTVFKTTNGGLYWVAQSSGYSNYLVSANFPASNTGYISGSNGLVLKTTNSGYNWVGQTTPVSYELHWIFFINNLTGWATGYGGTIIKTTDGGVSYPVPLAPELISPPNNSVNISLTPTLFWSQPSGAINYTVQVSTTPNFLEFSDSVTITNTQYTIPSGKLQQNTTYYWRVKASNSVGSSPWSSIWNFTTNNITTPIAPTLISPVNGSSGILLTPTLDWSDVSSATNYHVQVSYNSTFTNIADSATVTSSQRTIPVGNLYANNIFYWRVKAGNSSGYGPWSTVWYFYTATTPPPPTLISPVNNATNQPLTPTLVWDSSSITLYYKVQISTSSNFTDIVDSATISNHQYTVPSGKLFNNTTYFWRVYGGNIYGISYWSVVWSFTVNSIGLSQNGISIPGEFKLYSNYPNPFNPVTKIKFDLPKKAFTSLIIYDALGRTVETLVNTELKEGSYEYIWNAVKYNSGIYFIRIVSDKYVETRKMVLLK